MDFCGGGNHTIIDFQRKLGVLKHSSLLVCNEEKNLYNIDNWG